MLLETYFAYLATLGVFFGSPPGPSQALMIANSLRYGVRASSAGVAGDLTANALQMTAAAFGLAVIISTSYWALAIVKWAGMAYLLWTGWRCFNAPPTDLSRQVAATSGARLWRQGFITSATNPKAVFFFAALFPQFIDARSAIAPQLAILGATYLLVDGILLFAWGTLAHRLLSGLRNAGRMLNRVSGGLMMAAAALLALKDIDAPPLASR